MRRIITVRGNDVAENGWLIYGIKRAYHIGVTRGIKRQTRSDSPLKCPYDSFGLEMLSFVIGLGHGHRLNLIDMSALTEEEEDLVAKSPPWLKLKQLSNGSLDFHVNKADPRYWLYALRCWLSESALNLLTEYRYRCHAVANGAEAMGREEWIEIMDGAGYLTWAYVKRFGPGALANPRLWGTGIVAAYEVLAVLIDHAWWRIVCVVWPWGDK